MCVQSVPALHNGGILANYSVVLEKAKQIDRLLLARRLAFNNHHINIYPFSLKDKSSHDTKHCVQILKSILTAQIIALN